MTDIIERMNKAIYQKGVHPAEIREVVLGETSRGLLANISMSGEQMISKVEELRKLLANIDSYSSSITTALHDLVNKYNAGANRGLRMDEFSGYTNAKGKQLTMNDLAYAIINQEKQITDMGNLSRQLSASLDSGSSLVAVPITNYASYMDATTYLNNLSGSLQELIRLGGAPGLMSNLGGLAGIDKDPKAGLNVNVILDETAKAFQEKVGMEYSGSPKFVIAFGVRISRIRRRRSISKLFCFTSSC